MYLPAFQAYSIICANSVTAIKKTLVATERGRADVQGKRRLWHKKQKLMKLEPHRLVFIDETGTKTNMTRMYGRSLKGERLTADAPYGHWQNQTFIAGLRHDGITAPWMLDGPMNERLSIFILKANWLQPSNRVILLSSTTYRLTKAREPKLP